MTTILSYTLEAKDTPMVWARSPTPQYFLDGSSVMVLKM